MKTETDNIYEMKKLTKILPVNEAGVLNFHCSILLKKNGKEFICRNCEVLFQFSGYNPKILIVNGDDYFSADFYTEFSPEYQEFEFINNSFIILGSTNKNENYELVMQNFSKEN